MIALKPHAGHDNRDIARPLREKTPAAGNGNTTLFADVLRKCHQDRRTGLLNVAVAQSSQFLIRVYFRAGDICRFSYGPLHGRECLEFLEFYDLGNAVYLDGMKSPQETGASLSTEEIIAAIEGTGKTVRLQQWVERKGDRT